MIQVNKIITISLRENRNRQKLTEAELKKLNLKTDFFLVDRDKGFEERGCFNSHVQACKQALNEGCNTVLVFEDDVKILPYKQTQIDNINRFLKQQTTNFDILYLGLIIGKMWFCGYQAIVRTKGAGAHAYILSRKGMEKLAACEYNGIPIDKIMKNEFKCYSVYPIIAEQYPETIVASDITPNRSGSEIKDDVFWQRNYQKQKCLPWKNLHKSIAEIANKFLLRRK